MSTTQSLDQSLDVFAKTALHNWEQAIKRASASFDGYTDEELLQEIVPGKNRVVYLLGHFAAVHDRMLPMLGLGDRHYPHLDELFITSPDNTAAVLPSLPELRNAWKTVNEQLTAAFRSWTAREWLQKHTAVSDEDFAKEPHRNRLGVVLGRTGHVQYHLGQLVWFKK
jgi:hypothetical protein